MTTGRRQSVRSSIRAVAPGGTSWHARSGPRRVTGRECGSARRARRGRRAPLGPTPCRGLATSVALPPRWVTHPIGSGIPRGGGARVHGRSVGWHWRSCLRPRLSLWIRVRSEAVIDRRGPHKGAGWRTIVAAHHRGCRLMTTRPLKRSDASAQGAPRGSHRASEPDATEDARGERVGVGKRMPLTPPLVPSRVGGAGEACADRRDASRTGPRTRGPLHAK